jgi:hypothetical protein
MPRVTKTKAPVVATPKRATRSTVRAGSASLEEPVEVPVTRRRSSRSKTPDSKHSSFEKVQPEQHHLPALVEEVEQSPRITLPQPIEVAPIVDASPYVTPQHYHLAAARNSSVNVVSQSPRSSPTVRSLNNKSPAVAQSIHNSPALAQSINNSPSLAESIYGSPAVSQLVSKSIHNSPSFRVTKSVRSSPVVSRSVQKSFELYTEDDQTEDSQDGYDLPSTVYDLPSDSYCNTTELDIAENNQEEEEAVQEAAASQLAQETAEAGLSQSHHTSPVLLKTPPTTASSLAGHSTSKRRRSARSGGFSRTPTFATPTFDDSPLFVDSPLRDVSGNARINAAVRSVLHEAGIINSSPTTPKSPLPTPLMERAIKNESMIPGLTDLQFTAVLMDMRREILRLRKIEEQYLAEQFLTSKQPQPAVEAPQQPAIIQETSPEIPRNINRLGDLRYQRTVATPARKRLLAQREAEKAAAAAAAAAEAEKAAEEEEQNNQTPSRSHPSSTSRSSLSSATSKRKSFQNGTPQPSSQNSAPVETPSASPAWGLTSLFGSVKSIFTHRPNFSPMKQIQEQSQEQTQEQPTSQSQQAAQQNLFTISPPKQQRRVYSSQQSPTPKPREPAPPASTVEEAEDDGLYGQTPRTTRRRGVLPGSMPRRKQFNAPAKPKETNADLRASQLALGAQKTIEREQAQAKADRLERERQAIVAELKLRDSAYNVGDKRKMQVNVDDLAVIPRKAAGASSGTYGLMDDFFNYDDDSDVVEMDEDEVQLLPAPEHPTKRVRIDDNVFQPKAPAPAPAPQPTTTSPVKQAAQQPTIPATPTPNYSQLTQQAIEKQRLRFSEHKPKQPSRLRNVERLSTGSTVGAPSPQQPITAPLQGIQEVVAPIAEAQEVAPVGQLADLRPSRIARVNWPDLGPRMATPEAFARADKIYTPELKALDHAFYMKGFANAMANSQREFL